MSAPLLSVKNLSVDFTQGERVTHAVRNASLQLNMGETLALREKKLKENTKTKKKKT